MLAVEDGDGSLRRERSRETRGVFGIGRNTGAGGVAGPWLFGALIDTGSRWSVFAGYLLGSLLMLAAALVALRWAVAAECKPLESVAKPLASIE